jgi:hypothetical protein
MAAMLVDLQIEANGTVHQHGERDVTNPYRTCVVLYEDFSFTKCILLSN